MKLRKNGNLLSFLLAVVIMTGLLSMASVPAFAEGEAPPVTLNKTATPLNDDSETQIQLSFPGKEDNLSSDIVFVLDKSGASDQTGINQKAMEFLENLSQQAQEKGLDIKVGVVLFNKAGNIQAPLTDIGTGYDDIKTAMTSSVSMGTNLHAGLLAGKQLLDQDAAVPDARKHLVLITDGATYLYSKDGDFTTAYTRSFGDPKEQTNPATGNPFPNGSDKKGGIWEYLSREYNLSEELPFSQAMTDPAKLETYLAEKRLHDGDYAQFEYEYNYLSAYLDIERKVTPIETDAVANIDAAFIHSDDTFQEIAGKYNTYVFFKNAADFDGTTFLQYMTRNTGGLSEDFMQLEKAVVNLIDSGSTVDDIIGKDFDFVNDPARILLSIGDEALQPETAGNGEYGFGPRSDGSYRFLLTVSSGAEEKLCLTINEPVRTTAPLTLTYYEKLVNVPKEAGDHIFNTNERAVLHLIDSNGAPRGSLDFPKPTVTYSVKANPQAPAGSSETPLTGDDSFLALWAFLSAAGLLAVILTVIVRRRRRSDK